MHSYYRHIGDYARDTGHLSALEHGIYNLLLDWYYVNEKPIPAERAARIGKCTPVEVAPVLADFFKASDDGWHHNRADREIEAYHHRAEVSRENGKAGGRPPKKKAAKVAKRVDHPEPKKTGQVISGTPDVSQGEPDGKATINHLPVTTKPVTAKTPARRPKADDGTYSPKFEEFWLAYPERRRTKKKDTYAKWVRERLEEYADTIIRDVLKRQREDWKWIKDDGEFVPGPLVYLNGERWNDSFAAPPRSVGVRGSTEQQNAGLAGSWADKDHD